MSAVLAAQGATASMMSMIPVVVAGGIVYKFTEAMAPPGNKRPKPRRKEKDIYSRRYTGNFGNVGY